MKGMCSRERKNKGRGPAVGGKLGTWGGKKKSSWVECGSLRCVSKGPPKKQN